MDLNDLNDLDPESAAEYDLWLSSVDDERAGETATTLNLT